MLSHINNDTTYALSNITQRLVHISKVDDGKNCDCICPYCKKPMIANKGEKNRHYFSHERKGEKNSNLAKCRTETIHKLAIQIIEEKKSVMLPPYYVFEKYRAINFVRVEIEERNDRSDIQPDITGVTDSGDRYLIEIKYTHGVDSKKKEKIYAEDLTCVEIDISNQRMDDLESFLLNRPDDRVWINNKYGFESIVDYYKKHGKVIRVIPKQKCKSKENFFYPKCERFITEISHRGINYIICNDLTECSYTIHTDPIAPARKQDVHNNDISKNKRELTDETFHVEPPLLRNQQMYNQPFRPKDAWNESNYKCIPDNISSLDEYYNNIHMNNVFYEEEGTSYKVLNYFRSENLIGVVLVRIQDKEKYQAGYVLISKTTSFIHHWSKSYYDEHAATLSLKSRLTSKR